MGVDAVIAHATWLHADGSFARGHLLAVDGRIRTLAPHEEIPHGVPTIDARGALVVPGMVDAHTHFREPGESYKEGVANGSRAALKGGVTTVLDMPNNRPPCTTTLRVASKRNLFSRRCLVNWGLHVMALPGSAPPDLPHASGKVYMARASSVRPVRTLREVGSLMERWPQLCFHAEDEGFFRTDPSPLPHHERRPRKAILEALATIERGLERTRSGPRVVLCHVSTVEEVAWVRQMRRRGFDLWAETCPHYLWFTQEDCLASGGMLKVNPPLRTASDRQALLEAVADGTIDFLSSDHAPHTPEEKRGPNPPSGIAGLEWLVPLCLHLVDEGILSWRRYHDLTTRAGACYGIKDRGGIAPGAAADLVVVARGDPHRLPTVTKAQATPYAGLRLGWEVKATMVGGTIAYRDGRVVVSTPGHEVLS